MTKKHSCIIVYTVDVSADMSLFVGCHLKFHKHHYDNSEEFVGYCKGKTFCGLSDTCSVCVCITIINVDVVIIIVVVLMSSQALINFQSDDGDTCTCGKHSA